MNAPAVWTAANRNCAIRPRANPISASFIAMIAKPMIPSGTVPPSAATTGRAM